MKCMIISIQPYLYYQQELVSISETNQDVLIVRNYTIIKYHQTNITKWSFSYILKNPPSEIKWCLMGLWTLSDRGYADASGGMMWPHQIAVVLISLTAQWIKDAGYFCLTLAVSLMAKEGNKHITSVGSEGSIRKRERREGWRGWILKTKQGT